MATVTGRSQNSGILLDAGTGELEVLVLDIDGDRYGVNVAKVREVLEIDTVTSLPNSHPAVEGVVHIRGQVVELVNLRAFLNGSGAENQPRPTDKMLVMEFNQEHIAFRVGGVDRIIRTAWTNVQPMPQLSRERVPVTAIVQLNNRMVLMLDYESIGASIGMCRSGMQQQADQIQQQQHDSNIEQLPVIFAEDSQMVSEMITDSLHQAGFQNVRGFPDGQACWDYLQEVLTHTESEDYTRHVAALISDIEMPRMDGLTLTRRVREHNRLNKLPVVLFSSIVSKDNEKKGLQVGADAQVCKPRHADLVSTLRRVLSERHAG